MEPVFVITCQEARSWDPEVRALTDVGWFASRSEAESVAIEMAKADRTLARLRHSAVFAEGSGADFERWYSTRSRSYEVVEMAPAARMASA